MQRTLSVSSSNTDSFTNVKIDELSSLRNLSSNTDSCFNSHHQQMQSYTSLHSKSLSPRTPQSPKEAQCVASPVPGHQSNEFVTDEFYIDESLPSSLSIETGQSQGEFVRQLDTANNVVALLQVHALRNIRCLFELSAFLHKLFLCTFTEHEHYFVSPLRFSRSFRFDKINSVMRSLKLSRF